MSFFEFPHTRNYDSDLGWLIRTVKKLCEAVEGLDQWTINHQSEYEELKKFYDDLQAGIITPEIESMLINWITVNAPDIIGAMIKMVFFGLTDTGYFVAYIPDSWNEIIFNTTEYDIFIDGFMDFGHLVLTY